MTPVCNVLEGVWTVMPVYNVLWRVLSAIHVHNIYGKGVLCHIGVQHVVKGCELST